MKKIEYDGFALCEYDNEKIYDNFRTIEIFCAISFGLSIVTAIVFTALQTDRGLWSSDSNMIFCYVMFYLTLLGEPFAAMSYGRTSAKKPSELNINDLTKRKQFFLTSSPIEQDANKKKFSSASTICTFLIYDIIKVGLTAILFLCGIGSSDAFEMALYLLQLFGWMCIPHSLIYAAAVFLISNCFMMKAEWEKYIRKANTEVKGSVAPKNTEKTSVDGNKTHTPTENAQPKNVLSKKENEKSKCEMLLEKCGMRFFIKYFDQLSRLPLRDITVDENYDTTEREERIVAAQEIIKTGMAETALMTIVCKYSDILSLSEITRAGEIISQIANEDDDVDKVDASVPDTDIDSDDIDLDYDFESDAEFADMSGNIRRFTIVDGDSPERVRDIKVETGSSQMLVYDGDDCVGVVWKHYDSKHSKAIGQAEIRFFPRYEQQYGVWHRMFSDGYRLQYDGLRNCLDKNGNYTYFGKIRGH